jgi:hypothetical protein
MVGVDESKGHWPKVGFLVLVNLIAIACFYSPGCEDVGIWLSWIDDISTHGLISGFAYTGGVYMHDYPPLTFVMLAAVSRCPWGGPVCHFEMLLVAVPAYNFSLLLLVHTQSRSDGGARILTHIEQCRAGLFGYLDCAISDRGAFLPATRTSQEWHCLVYNQLFHQVAAVNHCSVYLPLRADNSWSRQKLP